MRNMTELIRFLISDRDSYRSETQQAAAIGIPQQTLNYITSGKRKYPRANTLFKLLAYCDQREGEDGRGNSR